MFIHCFALQAKKNQLFQLILVLVPHYYYVYPLVKRLPAVKATFSLPKGWSYKTGTTVPESSS